MDRTDAAQAYGETIVWEQPIQYVAADYLRPGDVVFDVGANVGGLSVAFSRMVGLKGSVVAFECNPPIIDVFKRTMTLNSIENVKLIERAAYTHSGEILTFGAEPSFYAAASSLFKSSPEYDFISVESIALDDVPAEPPRLIKLDVEGAEFCVLGGAKRLLRDEQPIVVLEYVYVPDAEADPLESLASYGYSFYDVNTYESMTREHYRYVKGHSNVLALPPAIGREASYVRVPLRNLGPLGAIKLSKGRWIIRLDLEGPPDAPATLKVEGRRGDTMSLYMGPLRLLQDNSNSFLVLDLDKGEDVNVSLSSESPDVRIASAELFRVDVRLPARGTGEP